VSHAFLSEMMIISWFLCIWLHIVLPKSVFQNSVSPSSSISISCLWHVSNSQ
jgi:hypothetical protein